MASRGGRREGAVSTLASPAESEIAEATPQRGNEELTDSEVGRALNTPEAPQDDTTDQGVGVALSVEQIEYLKSRTTKLSVEIENQKDPNGLPLRPTHGQIRKWVAASVPGVIASAEESTGSRVCLLFEDSSARKVFEVGVRRMTMWKGRQTWNYVFEPSVADLVALMVNGTRFKPSTMPLVTECLSPYHVRELVGEPRRPPPSGVWETVRKRVRGWLWKEDSEELEEAIPRAPEGLSKTPGLTVRTLVFNDSSLPPSDPVRIKDNRRQVRPRPKPEERRHPVDVVVVDPDKTISEEVDTKMTAGDQMPMDTEARVQRILESAHGGSILHELAPASPGRRRINQMEPPLRRSPERTAPTRGGVIEDTLQAKPAQDEIIASLLKEQERLRQQLEVLNQRRMEEDYRGEGANSTWLPRIPVERLQPGRVRQETVKPPAATAFYEYTPEDTYRTSAPCAPATLTDRTPKRPVRACPVIPGKESAVHWPEDINLDKEEEEEFVEFHSRTSTPQRLAENRNPRGVRSRSSGERSMFGNLCQKPPKITPFSGKQPIPSGEEDFDAFEFGVESLRRRYSEDALREGVHAALRAPASLSVRSLGHGANVDQIMEKLRLTYGPVPEHDSARAKFFSVQQDREEGVIEFMSRLDQLCERWVRMDPTFITTPNTRDSLMKERFFGGLRKGLQDSIRYLGEQKGTTFEQVFEAARKAEEILKTRKFLAEQNRAALGPTQHPPKGTPAPQKSGQVNTGKRNYGRKHGNNQARNAQQSENEEGAMSDGMMSLH